MAVSQLLLSCLLAVTVAAQAADMGSSNALDTLTASKADLYRRLVEATGTGHLFARAAAPITILAPTNEAVKAFLGQMGWTESDVKANPQLARRVVAYHTILGTAGTQELFGSNATVVVPTLDAYSTITTRKATPGVLKDAQGNQAKVLKTAVGVNHTVHVIDRVLFSGSYYKSLASLLQQNTGLLSTFAAAAARAGPGSLTKQAFNGTAFLPINSAFKKAQVTPATAPKAALEAVVRQHVLPDARSLPGGFPSGKPVPTLLHSQPLTVTYKDVGRRGLLLARRATVMDAQGNTASVVKPNLIIGSAGVAHVVDGVLLPSGAAAAGTTAPRPAAGGRRLLQRDTEFYMPTNGGFFRPPNTIGAAYEPYYQSMDYGLNNDYGPAPPGTFDSADNQGAYMAPDWPTYKFGR